MADFSKTGTLSLTCPVGMADSLQSELKELGYSPLRVRKTGVDVKGNLNDAISLNFWLRTAHRVLYLIDQRRSPSNPEELYKWIGSLPWETYIPSDGYLSVTSRIDHPSIRNTQFANVRVKDAVVDRIRNKMGERPDSGSDLNQTVLFLYWDRKGARIFLDTSGESLSRRGYRTSTVEAPIQESLAAAILHYSGWSPGDHLINPMCGSGTLVIEAALMAMNRPPATLRHDFGFMHILGYESAVYDQIRQEARKQTVKQPAGQLIATDSNPEAIRAAKRNAKTAGVDKLIRFDVCDFNETTIPEGDGIVLFNPPYGERLDKASRLSPLYKEIGNFMKQSCPGKTGYVLTGNFELAKQIGLRTNRRIQLFNSTIECRLLEYELFKGTGG